MTMKISEYDREQLFDEFQFAMQQRIFKFMQQLNEAGIEPAPNVALAEAAKAIGAVVYASVSQVPNGNIMDLSQKPIIEIAMYMSETVKALAGEESIISVTRADQQ